MRYRRTREAGGCFFFTVVTWHRQPILTLEPNIQRLRAAFRREMAKNSFVIDAIVILPDHLHTLWRLPEGDSDYSGRWNRIKRYFSTNIDSPAPSAIQQRKREKAVWQKRFWEHRIQDEEDWRKHMDYIHYNPVKHGLVAHPEKWPFSSFKRNIQRGWYAENWGHHEPGSIVGMNPE